MANDGSPGTSRRRPADRPRPAISERAQADIATIARARALEDRALALLSGALDAHPDSHGPRPLSPGLRAELARRVSAAVPEARALLAEADALLWQIVATYESVIQRRAERWAQMVGSVAADPDDLAAAARLGCWRALLRWKQDGGSSPLHFALQWAESAAQRDNTTTGDLCGGLSTKRRSRGWNRPRATIAARLDAPIRTPSGDPGAPLMEFVPGDDADTDEHLHLYQLRQQVEQHVRHLHPRAQAIIRARLEGQFFDEIAASFGISRERVRQIESAAIDAIRRAVIPQPPPPPKPPRPPKPARVKPPAPPKPPRLPAPPAPGTVTARIADLLHADPAATTYTISTALGIDRNSASALAGKLRAAGMAPPRPPAPAPPPLPRTGTLATDLIALVHADPGVSVAAAIVSLGSTEASVRTVVDALRRAGALLPHDPARPGLYTEKRLAKIPTLRSQQSDPGAV